MSFYFPLAKPLPPDASAENTLFSRRKNAQMLYAFFLMGTFTFSGEKKQKKSEVPKNVHRTCLWWVSKGGLFFREKNINPTHARCIILKKRCFKKADLP